MKMKFFGLLIAFISLETRAVDPFKTFMMKATGEMPIVQKAVKSAETAGSQAAHQSQTATASLIMPRTMLSPKTQELAATADFKIPATQETPKTMKVENVTKDQYLEGTADCVEVTRTFDTPSGPAEIHHEYLAGRVTRSNGLRFQSDFRIKNSQLEGRVRNTHGEFLTVEVRKGNTPRSGTLGNHQMTEHGDIIVGQSLDSTGTRLTVQIAKKVEDGVIAHTDPSPNITEVVYSVVPDPENTALLKFEPLAFRKLSELESKDFVAEIKFKHAATPTSSIHGLNISKNSGKGPGGPNPQSPGGTR